MNTGLETVPVRRGLVDHPMDSPCSSAPVSCGEKGRAPGHGSVGGIGRPGLACFRGPNKVGGKSFEPGTSRESMAPGVKSVYRLASLSWEYDQNWAHNGQISN